MPRHTSIQTAIAALALGALASAAHADVIYSFNGASPQSYTYNGQPFTPTLDLTLDITSAAVQRGSFTLSGSGASSVNPALDYSGDVADWISLAGSSLPGTVTSSTLLGLGQFRLALDFNPATGAVTSTSFESAFDLTGAAQLSGTGSTAAGTFGSDAPQFASCDPRTNTCAISGTWTETGYTSSPTGSAPGAVPEPATFGIFGAGLIGLAALRRASRRTTA